MIDYFTKLWDLISTSISLMASITVSFFRGVVNVFELTYNFISNGILFINALPTGVMVCVYGILSISVAIGVLKLINLINPL